MSVLETIVEGERIDATFQSVTYEVQPTYGEQIFLPVVPVQVVFEAHTLCESYLSVDVVLLKDETDLLGVKK